jgi:hypothetical protein
MFISLVIPDVRATVIKLEVYSLFLVSEDSRSLASEMAPACRPRTSRRGSKRLSIKEVFSSSMLSGLKLIIWS